MRWLFPLALVVAVRRATECEFRRLALAYAAELQPWRDLTVVHAALRLGAACGDKAPPAPPPGPPSPLQGPVVHVGVRGDDLRGDGSPDRPFATPHRGRDALRALSAAGGTVLLGNGTFFLARPLILGPDENHHHILKRFLEPFHFFGGTFDFGEFRF